MPSEGKRFDLDNVPYFAVIPIDSGSPIITRRKVMAWRLNETLFLEGRGMGLFQWLVPKILN
jgi:hypothetical protein